MPCRSKRRAKAAEQLQKVGGIGCRVSRSGILLEGTNELNNNGPRYYCAIKADTWVCVIMAWVMLPNVG
jgi:hypothetical protein